MMTRYAVWPGTEAALKELSRAIGRHCDCQQEPVVTCSAHRMLLEQHTLNHLDYVYRMRQAYIDAEHHVG